MKLSYLSKILLFDNGLRAGSSHIYELIKSTVEFAQLPFPKDAVDLFKGKRIGRTKISIVKKAAPVSASYLPLRFFIIVVLNPWREESEGMGPPCIHRIALRLY